MAPLKTEKENVAAPLPRPSILLIEDERDTAQEMAEQLDQLGYLVKVANTIASGLRAGRLAFSLMIVDRMLHGVDSLPMVETLRNEGIQSPILFVSALTSMDERIRGLRAGGDDYLIKPFGMRELVVRVEVLLRRSTTRVTTLRVGPLELDLIERRAWRAGREFVLLPREFKLLEYMMRHPDQLITRAMLFEGVWNLYFPSKTDNLIDVQVGKVKRKVDEPGETPLIQSVRGKGFMLHAPD